MPTVRPIELLSPARDLRCAIAAVNCGADAVYMGAPKFSARSKAGCGINDVRAAAEHCHTFGARLYVALNTLLRDDELKRAALMANELWEAGADALIVQDPRLLAMGLPPIELHASTQMDIRTPEKAALLARAGFTQIVVARELDLEHISGIRKRLGGKVRVEAFVHGALCVCYSGRCYMSLASCGRSANRGECAQPCRLPYSLTGADGKRLCPDGYLLSLKDMNRSEYLEAMVEAGVDTFKIEGRLKDASYVANVTLHYRRALDRMIEKWNDNAAKKQRTTNTINNVTLAGASAEGSETVLLRRSSCGRSEAAFEPDPERSFNRGFTPYLIKGDAKGIANPITPKSVGKPIGRVVKVGRNSIVTECAEPISNNDGLCYVADGELRGLKVNTAEAEGDRKGSAAQTLNAGHNTLLQKIVFEGSADGLRAGTPLSRNQDAQFERLVERGARRTLEVVMSVTLAGDKLRLRITEENGVSAECSESVAGLDEARLPDATLRNAEQQLRKLGDTPFRVSDIDIADNVCAYFIPASFWNALRRGACAKLEEKLKSRCPLPLAHTDAVPNGSSSVDSAPIDSTPDDSAADRDTLGGRETAIRELVRAAAKDSLDGQPLMTTRHCILRVAGKCLKQNPELARAAKEATLTDLQHGARYKVSFDCAKCEMRIT